MSSPEGDTKGLSLARWHTNPWQMVAALVLGVWSALQLTCGYTPGTPFSVHLDSHAQVLVSSANLMGAVISLVGLHMRDLDSALWVEVIGYVSLVGSLLIYIWLVGESSTWFNTSYGYGLSWAFVISAAMRTVQIFAFKRAERRAERLRFLVSEVASEGPDDG